VALEHALLVALRERPAAGLELARRFDRSIGFFWSATHQQIYKVLRRMEDDGWVTAEVQPQTGAPDKRVYTVTDVGTKVLADWIATTTPRAGFRSEIAVKMRAASYGDRAALPGEFVDRRVDPVGPDHGQEPHLAQIDEHRGAARGERSGERLLDGPGLAHVDLATQPDEDVPSRLLRDLDLDHSLPDSDEPTPAGSSPATTVCAIAGTLRRK